MKKFFLYALALASAMTVSCTKEETPIDTQSEALSISFVSAKPGFDNETKTAWNGTSATWRKGDKIRVACLQDGTTWRGANAADASGRAYATTALEADTDRAVFTLNGTNSFADLTGGSFVFYSTYPYYPDNAKFTNPSIPYTLAVEQALNKETFAAACDILVGKSSTLDSSIPVVDKEVNLQMYWKRLVAHTYLTLNKLATDGDETLTSVKLVAQKGAELTGKFTCEITDGEIAMTEAHDSVIVNNGSFAIANSTVSTWLTILPTNVTSLTVEATTNKAKYTRTIPTCNLNFLSTHRNVLNINMESAKRVGITTDTTVEASFSPAEFTGQGTSGSGSAMSATLGDITISTDKGYGTTQARFYAGSKMTISSSAGDIKSVKFTFNGSYTGGLNATYSNINAKEWTMNLTSQARIMSIVVEYCK